MSYFTSKETKLNGPSLVGTIEAAYLVMVAAEGMVAVEDAGATTHNAVPTAHAVFLTT